MGWTLFACLFLSPSIASGAPPSPPPDRETCLECHSDRALSAERGGRTVSLFVDQAAFAKSIHAGINCSSCHAGANPDDLPHEDHLPRVVCGSCHEDAQVDFDASIHGQALHRNAPYAPRCTDCHGAHDVLSAKNPAAQTFKTRVPYLCGGCHREGAPVARTYDISEHNILENYSESIHGEGLFKKGLTVTATCSDCHRPHLVLPHSDPRSSIAPRNIAATCMQCHSRIEEVHVQVIRGELWEKAPGAIPACVDCHLPHKVRKEIVELAVSDRECLRCHGKEDLKRTEAGKDTLSLYVDRRQIGASVHQNIPCVKCHSDIDPRLARPCETANEARCSNCHARMAEEYAQSGHGRAAAEGVAEAPRCTTCHGDHGVGSHKDEDSPTYRAAVPALCGECHRENGKASQAKSDLTQPSAFADYSASVHGQGLTEKGLLPSAICIDCHGAHLILPHTDNRSSVYPRNVPATCATCHRGIYKQFTKSVHFSNDPKDDRKLPTCSDCHSAHTIRLVERDAFMTEVTHQCGTCHGDLAETYLGTMHGKAYALGYLKVAKCSDCHGAHEILAHNDPNSSVGLNHIVATCQKCHEDANARFTGYLTHATHHDPVRYPTLFYTYWAMTALLVGVFGFFGIHTLLWLPRSFRELAARRRRAKEAPERYYIRRFGRSERATHIFVMVSFMSLALTGMMLKFSGMEWAGFMSRLLGGVKNAGIIHRTAAVVTFGYFAYHITTLVQKKRRRKQSWRALAFGRDSLMFNRRDLADFLGTLRWFFGKGVRPEYGRWTYWEKFDYLAVFWGVAVIGLSGLMLWFPEFFTKFVPGPFINVATIIHSDEALLAVGFIFTVHFFNTHLRPEAFPMDTVIFTGAVPASEYRRDRPREYEEMKASGELARRVIMWKPNPLRDRIVRTVGFFFLTVGVLLILLILYSVLRGYV